MINPYYSINELENGNVQTDPRSEKEPQISEKEPFENFYSTKKHYVVSIILSILATCFAIDRDNYTIITNDTITDKFQGWGTSMAWWAEFIGTLDDTKQLDFLNNFFNQTSNTSLRFNIVRFNIGGGPSILENGTTLNSNFDAYKGIPSFLSPDGTYNWTADISQVKVLLKVSKLGVNVFEAFSNSPPYFMTITGSSMGNKDGDNLPSEKYIEFAEYISTVVLHAQKMWNISFTSIDPFNEPRYYWNSNNKQEGNHWYTSSQKSFIPILKKSLSDRNLSETVKISASDDFSAWDGCTSLMESDGMIDDVGNANIHGYRWGLPFDMLEESISGWNDLYIKYQTRVRERVSTIWMSESGGYGSGDQAVISFGYDVIRHLNLLKANAWIYWQILDAAPKWALMTVSPKYPWWFSKWNYNPQKMIGFYVMMQFSQHIRPGYRIIGNSKSGVSDYCFICVLTCVSDTESKLIVIILNKSARQNFHTINISKVKEITNQTSIKTFRTSFWRNETHTQIHDTINTSIIGSVIFTAVPFSITTIVFV